MPKKSGLIYLLAVLLVVVVAAGILTYRNKTSPEKPTPEAWPELRIGYLPIAAELPLFVAVEKKYLEAEGIRYQLTRFTSSNELGNAATADRIDVMAGTASNVIFDISVVSGKRHLIFAVNPYSNRKGHVTDHLIVGKQSGITKLSDLAGKKIASFPGSVNRIFVNLILEKYGVPRDSYQYLEMPPPNWQPALEAGSIDAVSALEPSATQIIHDGTGVSIFPGFYADLFPDAPLSGHWIAADYYARSDKAQLAAFLRAYARAIQFCRTNEAEARKYLATYANVRADILEKVNLNPWQNLQEIDANRFQAYIDLLAQNGALQKRVEIKQFLLPRP